MECTRCGATNPDDARWCGQCYASFAEPEPEPVAERDAVPQPEAVAEPAAERGAEAAVTRSLPDGGPPGASVPERAGTPSGARAPGVAGSLGDPTPEGVPAPPGEAGDVGATGFRRHGDAVEWQCVTCGEFNALELTACGVCGTSIAARFEGPETPPEPSSWGAAFALSALLPGSGHYLAGRAGSGVARGLLYLVWLTGGLVLLLGAGAIAAFAAVPLLLGAFAVWAGTLLDLVSIRRGDRELLSGRALLWLVVAVTVLLLLGAFGGAARLT